MHSTSTQLLETVNDWTIAIKNHNIVDAIYFDYAKAFDSVSHNKLIHKLRAYGIDGQLLNVIISFLSNRSQRVVLPAGASTFLPVTSGVPQGSVLGPLLFLLYINDVSDLFTSSTKIKLYADDIKIYLEVNCNTDVVQLQNDIDLLSAWSNTWQLSLAVGKCFHLRLGLSKQFIQPVYTLNNAIICNVVELRDLGVLVDSRLTFSSHINAIVSKAHIRANQILRCFLSRDRFVLTKAFVTYVRPLVEYCSTLWNPFHINLINKLESVQRSFTKRLAGLSNLSYDERCRHLGLERLELRRLHSDLIYCFKIINGLTCLSPNDFFDVSYNSITRGHSLKLIVPVSRVDCRLHFFSIRVINVWNGLSNDIVTANSLSTFAKKLKTVNLTSCLSGKI
jgi:hypothetical protein